MIRWHPHTHHPADAETAMIAIRCAPEFPGDIDSILLPELYNYHPTFGWMGAISGIMLKHAVFWWHTEEALLEGLPQ